MNGPTGGGYQWRGIAQFRSTTQGLKFEGKNRSVSLLSCSIHKYIRIQIPCIPYHTKEVSTCHQTLLMTFYFSTSSDIYFFKIKRQFMLQSLLNMSKNEDPDRELIVKNNQSIRLLEHCSNLRANFLSSFISQWYLISSVLESSILLQQNTSYTFTSFNSVSKECRNDK